MRKLKIILILAVIFPFLLCASAYAGEPVLTPEPTTMSLIVFGLLGLGFLWRKIK